MKTLLQAFFLTFIFANAVSAQSLTPQVVASSGNFITNGNYSLSYTIGEAVVPTFSATGYILTQGFQQNDLESNLVQETVYDDLTIKVYPNPASDNVNILITSDKNTANLTVKLFDLLGRNINVPTANYAEGNQRLVTFNLANLASAMYFVTVYNAAENTTHTFKFNKINF